MKLNMQRLAYMYGITDEKFVRSSVEKVKPKLKYGVEEFRYRTPDILKGCEKFDHNDISIAFKVSPESLLNLAAKIVDALPLPRVYTWSIEDVCRWLRHCMGFPQYQRAFRDNFVNGRSLLLVDATALCAMNIKNFEHIRQITSGIRKLYYFEITKFGRSISLAPEFHLELYKLMRVKNGTKYETMKRSEFWRKMQLLREKTKYLEHWDILEQWLRIVHEPKEPELFGGIRRRSMYNNRQSKVSEQLHPDLHICDCIPPCACHWKKGKPRTSWLTSSMTYITKNNRRESVIPLLQDVFPEKYGNILKDIYESDSRSHSQRFRPSMHVSKLTVRN